MRAFMEILGPNDMMAYLAMMAPRLLELRRALKPTGSLYLHCDPTASHYLKLLLDAVFGKDCFQSEITWKRTGTHSSANRWGPVHDLIFYYTRAVSGEGHVWNRQYVPLGDEHKARHYRHLGAKGRRYTHGELTAPGTRNGKSGLAATGAAIGVLISIDEPTKAMRQWGADKGSYTSAFNGQKYPRIQRRTVEQLMAGVAIERPSGNVSIDETFKKAPKAKGKDAGRLSWGSRIPRFGTLFPRFRTGAERQKQAAAPFRTCAEPQKQGPARFRTRVEPRKQGPALFGTGAGSQTQGAARFGTCAAPQKQRPEPFGTAPDRGGRRPFVPEMAFAGAKQPVTIGTMTGKNIVTFGPLVDVLCGHPYAHTLDALKGLVASFHGMQKAAGKPFLVNETIPGSLDDAKRGDLARLYTTTLATAGLGWMGWALREGKAISTRRDRHDANGLNGEGFHPFFTREGKLRAGLEFLLEKPTLLPPWEKREDRGAFHGLQALL